MTQRLPAFLLALGCWLVGITALGQTLTVMTYNIRHGLTTRDQSNLSRISTLIKATKVDLVAIQEIDSATVRSLKRDQMKQLAKATDLKAVYAPAVSEARGTHGLAILSRYRIIASQTVQLPSPEEGAPRILLCAYVKPPNARQLIRFCTTKLDPHSSQNRFVQANTITTLLKESAQSVIWAGDLHTQVNDPVMQQLERYWQIAGAGNKQFTFPEQEARFDYILTRPADAIQPLSYRILNEKNTSDHYPVIATFKLK